MHTFLSLIPPWLRQVLPWLDQQPRWRVIAGGAALGLGLGLTGFVYLRTPLWVPAWVLLVGALSWLGWRAEPVFEEALPVVEAPLRPKPPGPRQVHDGPLTMMALPGGTLQMGSPEKDDMAHNDEKPQHQVTVSAFRIAVTPVTAGLYAEVMDSARPPADRAQRPAVDVSWFEALAFCNALSERQGYRPCYRQQDEQWLCDWQADGYRLPTEAEWEYACRAGTTTRYAFGDDHGELEHYGWFGKDFSAGPFEVAQKLPNRWGLYDMHGNVWEWCWNWYAPYPAQPVHNPHGPQQPDSGNSYKVVRGGSFDDAPEVLRSARRVFVLPVRRVGSFGFRCVRVPPALTL